MQHDVAARRRSKFAGSLPVLRIRIGYVNRTIELAVLVVPIQNVNSLRSLVVALSRLRTRRAAAESDFINLEYLFVVKQRERARALDYNHSIRNCVPGQTILLSGPED